MRAGTLRHRITVKRPLDPDETTQDSAGREEGSDVTVGEFWCNIEALIGRELSAVQQRWAQASYKITMRRQTGITFSGKMYAMWGDRRLNIVDVRDIGESFRPEVVLIAESYEA